MSKLYTEEEVKLLVNASCEAVTKEYEKRVELLRAELAAAELTYRDTLIAVRVLIGRLENESPSPRK